MAQFTLLQVGIVDCDARGVALGLSEDIQQYRELTSQVDGGEVSVWRRGVDGLC